MNFETCKPIRLPPKHLDWERLSFALGLAREHLARFDEVLQACPLAILEILKWEEAIATIRSQSIESDLIEVLSFDLNKAYFEEKRAALLQKIVLAKEGLDFAIASANKPFNLPLLCKMHALLKKDGPNPKEIGKLRDKQNWIGTPGCPIEEAYFFPPKAHLLAGYLKQWQNYGRKKTEPLIQLALLFAQFLVIHPFMDGNGRVARNHIPAFLYKKRLLSKPFLFLSSYFENHRLKYIQNLFNVSENQNWEEWILYFLKGIILRSDEMRGQVSRIQALHGKIKTERPFLHPISLKKEKGFVQHKTGVFVFEALLEIVNSSK